MRVLDLVQLRELLGVANGLDPLESLSMIVMINRLELESLLTQEFKRFVELITTDVRKKSATSYSTSH
jgi:hypothetical protein